MKSFIKFLVVLCVSAFAFTGIATAQDIKFFKIGTGGTGGTYYPIGGLIVNAVSNPPGSRPCDKGGRTGDPHALGHHRSRCHPTVPDRDHRRSTDPSQGGQSLVLRSES